MQIETEFNIGDYVRHNEVVYEVFHVDIYVQYDSLNDVEWADVLYGLVDVCDPFAYPLIIHEFELEEAEQYHIDAYIETSEAKEESEIKKITITLDSESMKQLRINDATETGEVKVKYAYTSDEDKSIDTLLDEYNDYKELKRVFGDENGQYEKRMNEVLAMIKARRKEDKSDDVDEEDK